MSRSITGTLPRRRSLRVVALLTAPAAALSLALLSACGAGQISQTDTMQPSVPGANVNSPHGLLSVRDAAIVYNDPNGYPSGGTAPLTAYLINNTADRTLTLRGVSASMTPDGPPIGTVVLVGGPPVAKPRPSATASAAGSAPASAVPGANPSEVGAPATGAPAPASASATATEPPAAAPSGGASAAPSKPAGSAALDIPIPPATLVQLAPEYKSYLAISGLTVPLNPGSLVYLTFNVAGEDSFGTQVPFGVPLSPPARIEDSSASGE